ncbi:MAG TPA: two-component regulator propeller domain-containing protein, partial [Chitinophagaceae bacterium]|nr:two-component regulator propeller domain-containing protein [Chitinophagaceae bacterium]
WLATLDGLQRYDGNRFLTFRNQPDNPATLPADIIRKVMEDGQGRLWVWSGDQVGLFDVDHFTYHHVSFHANIDMQYSRILRLDQDMNGNAMILVAPHGIFTYNQQTGAFEQTGDLTPLFEGDWPPIGYYHQTGSPDIWLGSLQGMAVFNLRTGHINFRGHNPDHHPLLEKLQDERSVIGIQGFQQDLFWYTRWDLYERNAPHIQSYNIKTGEKKKYSPGAMFHLGYTEIADGFQERSGRMWFYGLSFIIEYTGNPQQPFRIIRNEYKDEQSIRFDRVFCMYEDREHNIWIATDNGVFTFNPDTQYFGNYNLVRPDGSGTIDGPAASALQLHDGRVLVGAWASGLYGYDSALNTLRLPPSLDTVRQPYAIWSMQQQRESGLVWMGLQGGSLLIYDPKTGRADHVFPELIGGSTVRQITEDLQGNMWFGMQGGHIVKWDRQAAGSDPRKGFVMVRRRMRGYINKLFTDREGFVWAATEGNGTYRFDPRTNQELLHLAVTGAPGSRLWSDFCNDILQYNDSTLIIAGGALNLVNTRTLSVRQVTARDGLPSNTVYCLQSDSKHILWLGLVHGLCQFNLEKGIATLYDRRDGLRFDNFTQAGVRRLNDGRLLYVTDHSFMAFDPSRIIQSPQPAPALITGFRLAGRVLPVDSLLQKGKVSLNYDNTSVAIEFNTLRYGQWNKTHYFAMLEGVDKTWQEPGEFNQVVYNHLPPGTFVFRIRTENAEGVGSDRVTSLVIKVNPPFWRTWWFLGLVIFLVIGFLFWLDRLRMQKIRATESVRTRIATSLTEDLINSLSSINIASELAKIKSESDIQRTREYIAQISDTSNRMVQSMYDMVWSIDPKNDTMQDTIDRMKGFAQEMETIYGFNIYFDIDEAVISLNLDMENRYELLAIFKEAVINAVRHSGGKNIQVMLRLKQARFFMLIEDDGRGFDTESAALGRGINDMRRRAAAIQAGFYLESDINTGTIVKVEMPV